MVSSRSSGDGSEGGWVEGGKRWWGLVGVLLGWWKEAREALIKEGGKMGEDRARSKGVGSDVWRGARNCAVNV